MRNLGVQRKWNIFKCEKERTVRPEVCARSTSLGEEGRVVTHRHLPDAGGRGSLAASPSAGGEEIAQDARGAGKEGEQQEGRLAG